MHYFYDENNVRYTLAATNGGKSLNWIFIPGGPGVDSSYLNDLVKLLNCQGNSWLIDFPGNGSHDVQKDNFDDWLAMFMSIIKKFKNPVVVGHSFGGMLPLLFDELEDLLTGFVIINSAPCLWLAEAVKMAQRLHLPDLTAEMTAFIENPNPTSFNKALAACAPYYFPPSTLAQGRKLLASIPIAFEPAVWWQHKAVEISYKATWIPQEVKTLIIGAEFDAIVPFSLFQEDLRFNRKNIEKAFIKGAGHLPWLEKPEELKLIFENFQNAL